MAILKHVGTPDWDRERLNMSVNTPASWSVHAPRTRLGIHSGPAALRGLKRLNVLLKLATEKEGGTAQSFLAGHYGGIVLSSKRAKKVVSLSGSMTSLSVTWLVIFLWSVISCRPCHTRLVSLTCPVLPSPFSYQTCVTGGLSCS